MAPAVDRERANGSWAGTASPARPSDIPSASVEEFHTPQSSLHNEAPISVNHRDEEDAVSPVVSPSSVTSPPYWVNSHGHQRNISNVSVESILPAGAITLRDNETNDYNDRNNACWAKSVEIADYTIVNGSATNIGAFVVWNIRVETLHGSYMNIRKRYSEFDEFRHQLVLTFPGFEAAVPEIPPKSVISKFRPKFLEKRRAGLQYFLNCILLNPEFSGSPVLKDFLFA